MATKTKTRGYIELAAARIVLGGLALLPYQLALKCGSLFGVIAFYAGKRLRKTGRLNLALALPEVSEAKREQILRGSFKSLGRQLGLFSQIPKWDAARLDQLVDISGRDWFKTLRASGQPVVLITAHIGAWELLPYLASAHGYPFSLLVRRIDNPDVEAMVDRVRTRYGNVTIDKKTAARQMIRVLNNKEMLGVLIDLNTMPHEGTFVDFFGIQACTTVGVATLALRTNAIVIPAVAVWAHDRKRYEVIVDQPIEFTPTGNREADAIALTAVMTKKIEGYVRKYPDQWLWIHKRWKTRPEGERDLYAAL